MQTIKFDFFFLYIKLGIFRTEWKMANMVPIHKQDHKQNVKNYWPVLLLQFSEKKWMTYIQWNVLIFVENDLISPNQSGFKQDDSCYCQLLSVTHDIYQFLDQGYEVCCFSLDITKAFVKVWYKDLLHKLEQNGISGSLLPNFVKSRTHWVAINGPHLS